MNGERQTKSILNGYVGVKFRAVQVSASLPSDVPKGLYNRFRATGLRLSAYHMAPANGGNMSVRSGTGFFITAAGCNLGSMEPDELIFVEGCKADSEEVLYHGPLNPSSESIMHWLIYGDRPEARAIIHAHDEIATRPELIAGQIQQSDHEAPYGTLELARAAIKTFRRAEAIIVLKNHGYVAIAPTLNKGCDLVVATHLRLLSKTGYTHS